nr:loricrin-like [Arachis hypogaea]
MRGQDGGGGKGRSEGEGDGGGGEAWSRLCLVCLCLAASTPLPRRLCLAASSPLPRRLRLTILLSCFLGGGGGGGGSAGGAGCGGGASCGAGCGGGVGGTPSFLSQRELGYTANPTCPATDHRTLAPSVGTALMDVVLGPGDQGRGAGAEGAASVASLRGRRKSP